MKCVNPFISGTVAFGCGQCLPCRISRRRIWTHRIMLEALQHSSSAFITLTYSDEMLKSKGYIEPHYEGRLELNTKHLQDWLKRFRKVMQPQRLRFYAVGEYGDATLRPHYHVAVFGAPLCLYGITRKRLRRCCATCDAVSRTWGLGAIEVGILEQKSASYIAGYVTKKMTFRDDPRLDGREPEFARMSRCPGIGRDFIADYASAIMQYGVDNRAGDVPSTVRHGSKELPLGRYLRRRLREEIGREVEAPRDLEREAEMLCVLNASIVAKTSLREEIVKKWEGKVASMEKRYRIFNRRGGL